NFFWFVLGGDFMGLAWWLVGVVALITIVGIPWARACFVIGKLSFLPFGREVIGRDELHGIGDFGTGPFGLIGHVVWFLLAGSWVAPLHVVLALADFVTIIGLPFGIQPLKLGGIAPAPGRKAAVPREIADAARRANAERHVAGLRSR